MVNKLGTCSASRFDINMFGVLSVNLYSWRIYTAGEDLVSHQERDQIWVERFMEEVKVVEVGGEMYLQIV